MVDGGAVGVDGETAPLGLVGQREIDRSSRNTDR